MIQKIIALLGITLCFFTTTSAQDIFPKKKGGKYIYINNEGEQVFDVTFTEAKRFYNGRAAVLNNKWGFIDKTGNYIIPEKYDDVQSFRDSITYVEEDSTFYFINLQGETISDIYDGIEKNDKFYIVEKNQTFGILDHKAQILIDVELEKFGGYYKEEFTIYKDGKWGSWSEGKYNFNDSTLFYSNIEVVDQMPLFKKSCISGEDKKAIRKCNGKEIYQIVFENVKYPPIARENGIEGVTYARFVIDKKGQIQDLEMIKGHDLLIKESERVIQEYLSQWEVPASIEGEPTNFVFVLPIRYRLE